MQLLVMHLLPYLILAFLVGIVAGWYSREA